MYCLFFDASSSSSDNTPPFKGCGCSNNGSYRMDETVCLGCAWIAA